jgi:hypothetical protein
MTHVSQEQSAQIAPAKDRPNRTASWLCSGLPTGAFMRLGAVRRPTPRGDLSLVHYGIYRKYNYILILWFILNVGAQISPFRAFIWFFWGRVFPAPRSLTGNRQTTLGMNTIAGRNWDCRKASASRVARYPATGQPNSLVILVKYDNYTTSATFLCKRFSSMPVPRTSGALRARLESFRSVQAPS